MKCFPLLFISNGDKGTENYKNFVIGNIKNMLFMMHEMEKNEKVKTDSIRRKLKKIRRVQ